MNSYDTNLETTLKSLDNLQRLEVPINLKQAIKNNFNGNATIKMSTSQKLMLAASLIVLLGLNVVTMKYYFNSSNKNANSNQDNLVYKEYFSNSIE
jgi:hypothetical protein